MAITVKSIENSTVAIPVIPGMVPKACPVNFASWLQRSSGNPTGASQGERKNEEVRKILGKSSGITSFNRIYDIYI